MEAFLQACADGRIDPTLLTTHRYPIEEAVTAYRTLSDPGELSVGVVFEYPELAAPRLVVSRPTARGAGSDQLRVGLIGTGRFATRVLLPACRDDPSLAVEAIASERGLSTERVAAKYGAQPLTVEQLLDADLDALMIATRHDSHARLVASGLRAGLHVYVEKPLVRVPEELPEVLDAYGASDRLCMVGFNRRHAPATAAVKEHLDALTGPTQVLIRVNAGQLADHWLVDPDVGGGRLVGEGCHFIDLAAYLVGHPAVGALATGVPTGGLGPAAWQSLTVALDYADGSTATVLYTALGDGQMPKERVEVYKERTSAVIADFRKWEIWRKGHRRAGGGRVADKGHRAELAWFARACREGASSAAFADDVASTVTTFAALESLGTGRRVPIPQVQLP
jgi:polar amino acid transport system substrate-binding protein